MKIEQIAVGFMQVFCYLVYDEETKEGLDAEDVGIHSWADLQLPDALLH